VKAFSAIAIAFILILSVFNIIAFYYNPPQPEPDYKSLEIAYWKNFLKQYPQYKDGQIKLKRLVEEN